MTIHCENILLKRDQLTILNEISVSFTPGKIYGLFGPNGAGKTSLLKVLSGLMFQEEGCVEYKLNTVVNRQLEFLKECVFFTEDFLLASETLFDFRFVHSPFYKDFELEAFNRYLNLFGLQESTKVKELSLGQKKKAFLAFCLATNAKLMIFDEPTNGLDSVTRDIFKGILAELVSPDRTIICASHQINELESALDHAIILDRGKKIIDSSLDDIQSNFSLLRNDEEVPEALYSEKNLFGNMCLVAADKSESYVPLDLFYKAALFGERLQIQEQLNG